MAESRGLEAVEEALARRNRTSAAEAGVIALCVARLKSGLPVANEATELRSQRPRLTACPLCLMARLKACPDTNRSHHGLERLEKFVRDHAVKGA
jgi:hypothetical protein